jgi:predicted DNA-binding transcriptional regulator YafY
VPWLLGWGTAIKVIKPVSLQQRLITEANKIVAQYNLD